LLDGLDDVVVRIQVTEWGGGVVRLVGKVVQGQLYCRVGLGDAEERSSWGAGWGIGGGDTVASAGLHKGWQPQGAWTGAQRRGPMVGESRRL
jgi:hypothetical protein